MIDWTKVTLGKPDPTYPPPSDRVFCAASLGGLTCTRAPHVGGAHVAGTSVEVVAVWVTDDEPG